MAARGGGQCFSPDPQFVEDKFFREYPRGHD